LGGKRIRGSGNVVTEARNVSNFTGVDVSGAVHVFVKQDSFFSAKVEVDDNLQPYVVVREEGGVLYVHQERNTSLDATHDIKVYVTLPVVEDLEVSGASRIISDNVLSSGDNIEISVSGASNVDLKLKYPRVSADLSGASSVFLTGQTKELIIEGSGASHAKCFDLLSENVNVDISGATDAEVFASVKLDAEASGASHVKYKGGASVSQKSSGAGSVKKED
jgi:hypothetical protein